MPFNPLDLIPVVGPIIGNVVDSAMQAGQNRKNRAFAEHMHNTQRQEALADWNMQNQYNHPSSQMTRLREAGLNPNLVYGNGAVTPSAQMKSSEYSQPQQLAPKIDIGGALTTGLLASQDLKMKQAQVDNLRTQNTVLVQEALLKAAQIGQTDASTKKIDQETHRGQFDLEYLAGIKEMSIDALATHIGKMKIESAATAHEDARKTDMQSFTIDKILQDIASSKIANARTQAERQKILQEIQNLKQENRLKQFDEEMQKNNIPRNSPAWWKALISAFQGVGSGSLIGDLLNQAPPEVRAEYNRRK